MGASRKKNPQEKLVKSIDRLTVQIDRLERAITTLSNITGRAVFPQEAMAELSGCLRALVYLIDTEKKFSHMVAQRKPSPSDEACPEQAGG
jgi:hypothetical protein